MTPVFVEEWQCRHEKNHSRKISQILQNTKYEILCCDICADMALGSPIGGFTEAVK